MLSLSSQRVFVGVRHDNPAKCCWLPCACVTYIAHVPDRHFFVVNLGYCSRNGAVMMQQQNHAVTCASLVRTHSVRQLHRVLSFYWKPWRLSDIARSKLMAQWTEWAGGFERAENRWSSSWGQKNADHLLGFHSRVSCMMATIRRPS